MGMTERSISFRDPDSKRETCRIDGLVRHLADVPVVQGHQRLDMRMVDVYKLRSRRGARRYVDMRRGQRMEQRVHCGVILQSALLIAFVFLIPSLFDARKKPGKVSETDRGRRSLGPVHIDMVKLLSPPWMIVFNIRSCWEVPWM